jgi:hypothetical protein
MQEMHFSVHLKYYILQSKNNRRERPFNLKGGGGRGGVYGFFLKKIFGFPMLLKKIF